MSSFLFFFDVDLFSSCSHCSSAVHWAEKYPPQKTFWQKFPPQGGTSRWDELLYITITFTIPLLHVTFKDISYLSLGIETLLRCPSSSSPWSGFKDSKHRRMACVRIFRSRQFVRLSSSSLLINCQFDNQQSAIAKLENAVRAWQRYDDVSDYERYILVAECERKDWQHRHQHFGVMEYPSFLYHQIFVHPPPIPVTCSLKGQRALITGVKSGIDLETAREYVRLKAEKLILSVRSDERRSSEREY